MQTDGASATLLMSEEKALELGYKPKAYLRYVFCSSESFVKNFVSTEILFLYHKILKISYF